jgi:hypothetical protein
MSIDAIFGSFNAADVEPQAPRGLIDPGWYPAVINTSKTKINNAGTGSYLELEIEIIDGPAKGRRVWDRLNRMSGRPGGGYGDDRHDWHQTKRQQLWRH